MECFYCLSRIPSPANPRDFRCPICLCLNRYDRNGEIISSEPAMFDEALNKRSFAKRGSPRKDRISTPYGPGPFCHTCQTNQLLLINLLASFLPPTSDPDYSRKVDMMPEYRESLYQRYPPVCEKCLPGVEDEIRKKDELARSLALGNFLKSTKGKETQRRASRNQKSGKLQGDLRLWKIRGLLWATTLSATLLLDLSSALHYDPWPRLGIIQPVLPILTVVSLSWMAWDPYYNYRKIAEVNGKELRLVGRQTYLGFQLLLWGKRMLTSAIISAKWLQLGWDPIRLGDLSSKRSQIFFDASLLLELSVLLASFKVLHLESPPAVRLINSGRLEPSTASQNTPLPRAVEPPTEAFSLSDLLSTAEISSRSAPQRNLAFGQPPFPATAQPLPPPTDVDAMDVDPAPSISTFSAPSLVRSENVWLRPQRFFPPEHPTGLESLFEKTHLKDDSAIQNSPGKVQSYIRRLQDLLTWVMAISLIFLLVGLFGYRLLYVHKNEH